MRFVGVCVLMSLLCGLAFAQDVMRPENMPRYGRWRSSMLGGGGYIQNVVFTSDAKRLYAYVDVGGFYRSDDGARTWRMMHGNLPNQTGKTEVRGFLVDPANPDKILVACGSQWSSPMGIYASSDGGETFTQVLRASFGGNANFRWDGFILARDPKNPGILLAGTLGDGIFRSTDGGANWALCNDQTKDHVFTDVRFDLTDSSRAYACSLDWSGHMRGKQTKLEGGFFISTDGGAMWEMTLQDSPREMVQEPKTGRLVAIRNDFAGIQVSEDGAKTWRDLNDGLRVDPEKSKIGYVNTYRYNAITAGPDFTVVASTVGDFYRMPAGGSKWEAIPRESVNYRGWYGGNRKDYSMFGKALGSISIDPRDPNHWYFTDWFAIYETLDAGRNWTLRLDGIEVTVIHNLGQDPSDAGRVHMGMADNGYLISTDGGASFQIRKVSGNVKDVAASPILPARVYAAGTATHEWYSNQVFVSIDAGETWTRSPMTGLPDMKVARCNIIAVDPEDPYRVALTVSGEVKPGGGGPYLSTDGAKTWTWIGQGLPEGQTFYPDSIWAAGRQIAVGRSGQMVTVGRGAVWTYTDGAWSKLEGGPGGPIAVAADPANAGAFVISADQGLFLLSGGELRKTYGQRATHVAADIAKPGRFAASTHEGVVLSTDGGKTWTMLDRELPHAMGTNCLAFAGDRLLAGSGGSGVFWIPLTDAAEKPLKAKPVAPSPEGVFR